jgi:multidrug efflux system membrane fusion protein
MKYHSPLLILLLSVLLLYRCGSSSGGDTPAAGPPPRPAEVIPVRTAAVEQRTVALPVHASGVLTSSAEQRLSFKVGGIIRRVYADEGASVRKGQLLATLDQTEIAAQVSQAQQGLSKAERDLGRVEGLYRDSSATLELLENATTARDMARESARIARFNQQYSEIRATRSGKIVRRLMNEGEVAGPGMPVFVLFETGADDWVVRINVSDRDWARLRTGMPARIRLDAYPDASFTGRLSDLAPAADPASGLYPVEIAISPQGRRFAPGLFAQVDITPQQTRPYAVVPVEAIIEGDGQSAFVFALGPDGESVRKVPVQVAFLDGNSVVIAGGLEGVQEVVTAGAPYLTEKKKVRKVPGSGF